MYIERYIDSTIERISSNFKVLYLGGPRQVGKTTILNLLAKKHNLRTVSLDDLTLRELAQKDPALFLAEFPSPLFIDEAQYAPELFSHIKMIVDKQKNNGQYWLSGSQQFTMIKNIRESLAGRVAIVSLLGCSLGEELAYKPNDAAFLPNKSKETHSNRIQNLSPSDLYQKIFRGWYPALVSGENKERDFFYNSYIQTYLERDVVGLFGVEKISLFRNFLELLAARTASVFVASNFARDLGVSPNTILSWLSILESSGIVYILRPFKNNLSKRIIQSPKVYLTDTGLASYLTRWSSPETLQHGALAGQILETFVVGEIIKSYYFRGQECPLFYYRDKEKREIDCILEKDGVLFPIEIKKTQTVTDEDIRHLNYFTKNYPQSSHATVISMSEREYYKNSGLLVLPATQIL